MRAALAAAWLGWRLLAANRPRLIVLVAGSVSVALAASSIAAASVVSTATVQQTIADGWRGPYDILVRPPGSQSLTVGGRRIVPSNYLGTPSAGITRDQWQSIESIPGVDVAAPVAALGWMKPDMSALDVEIPTPGPRELVRIDVRAVVGDETAASTGFVSAPPADANSPPPVSVGVFGMTCGGGSCGVSTAYLPSVWGLVVGVDPAAEDHLVGLQTAVAGTYLQPGVRSVVDPTYGGTAVGVPVLTAGTQPLEGSVSVTVTELSDVDPAAIRAAIEARNESRLADGQSGLTTAEMSTLIASMTHQTATHTTAQTSRPFADLMEPLRPAAVQVGLDGQLTRGVDGTGRGSAYGRNVLLVPQPPRYAVEGGAVRLSQIGSWTHDIEPAIAKLQPDNWYSPPDPLTLDDAIFRPLQVTAPKPFMLTPLGTYDLAGLSDRFDTATNYAPLGIYGDAPRRSVNANGSAGDVLPRSLNPGGINPLPPVGLTNLEAVEALRGARFIDAIRVRVAGITGYSPDSLKQIEDVAAAIVSRTGLDVTVVAGSSQVDTDVNVEGVGTISERWTTLGEAPRIAAATSGFSGLLLWLAGAVVLLYLLTFGLLVVTEQATELRIVHLLGWRQRVVASVALAQASMLGTAAGVLGAGVTLLVGRALGTPISPWILVLIVVGAIVTHLLATLVVAALVRRERAVLARRGVQHSAVKITGLVRLALTHALESRLRLAGLTIALTASVALATFVVGTQIGLDGRLHATMLGQVVALRVGPYHLLAAGAAVFAAGAMAIDSGVLSVERRLAFLGLLRAIGWRAAELRRLIGIEVAGPAAVAGVLAGALAGLGLHLSHVATGPTVILMVAAVVVTAVVGLVAAQPASELALSASPGLTLRAEGASSSVRGFSARAAMTSVGSLAVIVVAGGMAFASVHPVGIAPGAIVTQSPPAPPTAAETRLGADIAAIAALPDRRIGSKNLVAAEQIVQARLESLGYAVSELPVVALTATLTDHSGNEVDSAGEVIDYTPVALAYETVPAAGPLTFDDITFIDGADSSSPCPPGLAVVRLGPLSAEPVDATFPAAMLQRCDGRTSAVLGLRSSDGPWGRTQEALASMTFPVGHFLTATSTSPGPAADTPWLVAPLGSTGPGATMSAAPTALALEVARVAAEGSHPLRLAFVADEEGEAESTFLRYAVATTPGTRMLTLGPLGGQPEPSLGVTPAPPDSPDVWPRVFMASVHLDDTADVWSAAAAHAHTRATGAEWLTTVSDATGLSPSDSTGLATFALMMGFDAAVITERYDPTGLVPSIAGTVADTADQVDVPTVASLATPITSALTGSPS